uniref:Uncharacterized protein n=1 Tax=Brassica oleracea var. oleracea TaxID=109376 RepID=A0A0D3D7J5_BRAOL
MSNDPVLSGRGLRHTLRPVPKLQALNREKLATVSSDDTRSMILSPSFVDVIKRQQGRKVAVKGSGKKTALEGKALSEFQCMWSIKQQDLAIKERLSKMSLLAKKEPLADYEEALKKKLINDFLSSLDSRIVDTKVTYLGSISDTDSRINKPLFMRIVDRLSNEVKYFQQKEDGLGRLGLSTLQKCTASIHVLAYGHAADTVDEYLRLGETTTRLCVESFVEGIINLFSDEYLRRPTPAVLQRLLGIGEHRGFPGMIGSIDCMHWEWKNCPTAWKGQYSRGSGKPTIVLEAVALYDLWVKLRKSLTMLMEESIIWLTISPMVKVKIGKIMRACIILHNMIVEDERDGYTQFDVSEFQQGEDNGSSHVDLKYSTDIPTNIANMMGVRTRIRDRQMHEQLNDLVEYVWRKFGRDEHNN